MKKYGKIICAILIGTLTLCPMSVTAAYENPVSTNSVLRWSLISEERCALNISGNQATADVELIGQPGVSKCSAKIEFQRKSGSSWVTISTKNVSRSSSFALWSYDFSVSSGQTYRVKATLTVTDGDSSETVIAFSNTVTA